MRDSHSSRPLRTMFVTSCMTVGGEEVLLLELVRRLDRSRIAPELCCLKYLGELGEKLAREIPTFTGLLARKLDVRVLGRLTRLLRTRQIDAVVTVGTGGDKMFWGRAAAWLAGVPVTVSAIHSTGWPTHVEWSNRRLEPITDAFIAVADGHARYIIENEGCPANKVRIIPNGVDTKKFQQRIPVSALQQEVGLPAGVPVAGLVAEIRPEKNHALWLRMAKEVHRHLSNAHFLIVGDGPDRAKFEALSAELGLADVVHFCGRRLDVPELLALMDVFVLSSDMEASPVSILEAMACGKPVISTRVGSIPESVVDGVTGYLCQPGDAEALAQRVTQLLADPLLAQQFGLAGRERVNRHFSIDRMVEGYQDLLAEIYAAKQRGVRRHSVSTLSSLSHQQSLFVGPTEMVQ